LRGVAVPCREAVDASRSAPWSLGPATRARLKRARRAHELHAKVVVCAMSRELAAQGGQKLIVISHG
jgi:hypothetical protein